MLPFKLRNWIISKISPFVARLLEENDTLKKDLTEMRERLIERTQGFMRVTAKERQELQMENLDLRSKNYPTYPVVKGIRYRIGEQVNEAGSRPELFKLLTVPPEDTITEEEAERMVQYTRQRLHDTGMDWVMIFCRKVSVYGIELTSKETIYGVVWENSQGTKVELAGITLKDGYPIGDKGFWITEV